MSRMIVEVYRAFKAANVPDAEAEAAARAVAEAGEGFVTNETLRFELGKLRQELVAEIAALRAEMHAEIAALRAEFRSELKTQLVALEDRLNRRTYMLFGALAVLITVYEFIGR